MSLKTNSFTRLGSVSDFEGFLGAAPLDVPYVKQEQSQWCWAACIEMVRKCCQHGDAASQCAMASSAFQVSACCTDPQSSLCNLPLRKDRVASEFSRYGYQAVFVDSSMEFTAVRDALDQGHLIQAGLKWFGIGGHAVLIAGWAIDSGEEQLIVHDPRRGKMTVTFSELRDAYGEGVWRWSWTGLRKATQ